MSSSTESVAMEIVSEAAVANTSTNETAGTIVSATTVTMTDINKTLSYITRGVELNQPRLLARAIRQNAKVRLYITPALLQNVLSKYIPSTNPIHDIVQISIEKLLIDIPPAADAPSPPDAMDETSLLPMNKTIPEIEVYLCTLLITTLLRYNKYTDAAYASTAFIERISSFNRRSLDILASKAYFYFSLAYEKISRLENIRSTLLNLYRTSCLHHDELSQAILLNLILRNYIHYNLFTQADILITKTTFPENASNNQFCRYLYYLGRIQAVQLSYSESHLRLSMAARKAPQDSSLAFMIEVHKLTVIVQLLMGDIPERSLFNQLDLRAPLKPYFYLTQAVRNGNLLQFNSIVEKYSQYFENDSNLTLINRLGFNVLKIGLRKIYLSYSRISLSDIAEKLHLPSIASAEYICSKAIRDGIIEATLDHDNGWLTSNDILDVYSTEEPQKAFHRRIAFCLDVHNEAIKSMRYPPDAYKKELKASMKSADDEKSIDELIRDMENDADDL